MAGYGVELERSGQRAVEVLVDPAVSLGLVTLQLVTADIEDRLLVGGHPPELIEGTADRCLDQVFLGVG